MYGKTTQHNIRERDSSSLDKMRKQARVMVVSGEVSERKEAVKMLPCRIFQ